MATEKPINIRIKRDGGKIDVEINVFNGTDVSSYEVFTCKAGSTGGYGKPVASDNMTGGVTVPVAEDPNSMIGGFLRVDVWAASMLEDEAEHTVQVRILQNGKVVPGSKKDKTKKGTGMLKLKFKYALVEQRQTGGN